jgi:type 1 fimbria pilin
MLMHYRLLPGLLMACLWLPPGHAYDGTINITGSIIGNTCTVSADSKAIKVSMGDVDSKSFSRVGDGTADQPFNISLEKCGSSASRVSITFSGVQDSQEASLLAITGGSGAATGLGVGIYDKEKNVIPLNSPGGEMSLMPNQALATLNFYARYVANGSTVTAGVANAACTFTLSYA